MNKIILVDKEMDPAFVRTQFDEILVREITSLMEIDSDIALLTYNLSTISTILIAVEREKEIRNAKEFPLKRFTFDTLVEELMELGLSKDDTLLKSVESVIEQGYLTQKSSGEIKAEVSAYTIVGFLDKIFPGMRGIQLIAFVMQMSDEVLSERKSLEDAKDSFAQTLKNSGVAVTREKAEKQANEIALDDSESRQMKEVALKLKESNIKRLAQQRLNQKLQLNKTGGQPSFHFAGGSRLEKVRITSVFDQGPSEQEIEAQNKAKEEAEKQKRRQEELLKAAEIEEQKRKIKEAEIAAKEIERKAAELLAKEQALRDAEMAALKLEQQQAELKAKELAMAAREAELKLREEQLKIAAKEEQLKIAAREEQLKIAAREEQLKIAAQKEIIEREAAEKAEQERVEQIRLKTEADKQTLHSEKLKDSEIEGSKASGTAMLEVSGTDNELQQTDLRTKQDNIVNKKNIDDNINDIESRIAAFEAELTISCPLCHNGEIRKEKTETGKEYFICSDKKCRFVSWSQPYDFTCPLCKNSFIVEFQTPSGGKGLKCPRASCNFSQNHLSDPAIVQNMGNQVCNLAQPPQSSGGHAPPQFGDTPQSGQTLGAGAPKKKRLVRRIKR